jgi:hypothetical protein
MVQKKFARKIGPDLDSGRVSKTLCQIGPLWEGLLRISCVMPDEGKQKPLRNHRRKRDEPTRSRAV